MTDFSVSLSYLKNAEIILLLPSTFVLEVRFNKVPENFVVVNATLIDPEKDISQSALQSPVLSA